MRYSYSVEFKLKVVNAVKKFSLTYRQAADLFDIGEASVSRWLRINREQKGFSPARHGGGRKCAIKRGEQLNRLKRIIDTKPDATSVEITNEYNKKVKVKVSRATILRGIKRIKYTRKKKVM